MLIILNNKTISVEDGGFCSYVVTTPISRVGDTLRYIYDFGDDWEHFLTIEKEMKTQPNAVYPRCVAGRNACPPEDCGGSWGYADLVSTLAGRRNARRRELIEWLGGAFDPKHFSLDEANERLVEYVAVCAGDRN